MDKKRPALNSFLCIAIISLTLIVSCGGGGGGGGDGDGGGGGGSVIYVKSDATGTGDGKSWSNAYTDLQTALTAAKSGNEIWVAAGVYKPTANADRSISFTLKNGLSLYGGFSGTETTRSGRNWEVNETILSGDIGIQGINDDNTYHVVLGADNTTIDGVTISGGNADGTASQDYMGGGICNIGTSDNIVNVTIANSKIKNNSSSGGGGGIYNTYCEIVINNCSFISNETTKGSGGGINCSNYITSMTGCIFQNNTAFFRGGAFCQEGGTSNISGCTFENNSSQGGGGGGIVISNGEISSCTFIENIAYVNGGGIYQNNCTGCMIKIIDSEFIDNSSSIMSGGGIYTEGSPTIINCIFKNNSAHLNGGGIQASSGNAINCTFSGNSAEDTGGAIYGGLSMSNCIIWGNTASSYPGFNPGTGNPILKNCCIEGGYSGSGVYQNIINVDPMFVTGSLALQIASPCINAGDNTAITSGVTTDIAGNPRIVNGTVDMGAYEYQQ